jgi:hypothetical protein
VAKYLPTAEVRNRARQRGFTAVLRAKHLARLWKPVRAQHGVAVLRHAALHLRAAAGGILPLIVALMPDSDDSATILWSGGALCKLTEAQLAGLLAWHAMANGSCAYNISDPDFSGTKTMFVC